MIRLFHTIKGPPAGKHMKIFSPFFEMDNEYQEVAPQNSSSTNSAASGSASVSANI